MLSDLWLLSRSQYEDGFRCPRRRLLGYHSGPSGYGWARKAQSVPAVTGTLIHQPITDVWAYLKEHDTIPPDTFIHAAIVRAQEEYRRIVAERGLVHTTDPDELKRHVLEQTTLLEGLVWTWMAAALPTFHEEWKVIAVEEEHVTVLGCTCGLGDQIWDAASHNAKGCGGVGLMTRGDGIMQRRSTGTYAYHDVKSTGMNSGNWRDTWAFKIQLLMGVLGYEAKLSVQIDECWVHPLYKGKHERTWDPEAKATVGPKFQNSPLVYAWRRPGNPPLQDEAWAAKYDYLDEDGKKRRLGKDYVRTGVWELPRTWWDGEDTAALSASHYWVHFIAPTGVLNEVWSPIGPIFREGWKLEQLVRQLVAHETRWREIVTQIYYAAVDGITWDTEEGQALLDQLVPMARGEECQNAFGDRCWALGLCNRDAGWQDPASMGFIARRPHHASELEQAVSRGLLPPDEGAAEGQEE